MLSIAALLLALSTAAAAPNHIISVDHLCRIQHALKHQHPAWTPETCAAVAAAMNATRSPKLTLAIAINESDLRERALARARRGVYDAGLMGVRCRLDPRLDRTPNRRWRRSPELQATLGLTCGNWPVRGRALRDLLDPVAAIEAGARVLERKRARSPHHYLHHYNGSTRDRGYADRIRVIKAAVDGKQLPTDSKRVEELAKRILTKKAG